MFFSLLIGSTTGIIYGFFFVTQKKKVLSSTNENQLIRHLTRSVIFSSFRVILFAACILYILHSDLINLIMVLISSTLSCSYIVYNKGTLDHE